MSPPLFQVARPGLQLNAQPEDLRQVNNPKGQLPGPRDLLGFGVYFHSPCKPLHIRVGLLTLHTHREIPPSYTQTPSPSPYTLFVLTIFCFVVKWQIDLP
ncbi:hypothetical protein RRG08_048288 [Elysia crispata]|uniref:Uncharacterized protein n=1 Tax=Elysia crispata TaxID=231223 RepID=A0AAE1DMQ0_9GAST|nr:hypothetical protein RRG08_048288 [Elysia crispata]